MGVKVRFDCLLCAENCFKNITCINSFNPLYISEEGTVYILTHLELRVREDEAGVCLFEDSCVLF